MYDVVREDGLYSVHKRDMSECIGSMELCRVMVVVFVCMYGVDAYIYGLLIDGPSCDTEGYAWHGMAVCCVLCVLVYKKTLHFVKFQPTNSV